MWGRTVANGPELDTVTPITAVAIRIPLGEIVDESRQAFLETANRWGAGSPDPKLLAATKEIRQEWAGQRRGRLRRYSPEHWQQVAEVYLTAWRAGGRPTAAVVAKFGVSKNIAAKWVANARQMGLLPPTTRGKAAGTASTARRRAKS
jgi:hypothetical protein